MHDDCRRAYIFGIRHKRVTDGFILHLDLVQVLTSKIYWNFIQIQIYVKCQTSICLQKRIYWLWGKIFEHSKLVWQRFRVTLFYKNILTNRKIGQTDTCLDICWCCANDTHTDPSLTRTVANLSDPQHLYLHCAPQAHLILIWRHSRQLSQCVVMY